MAPRRFQRRRPTTCTSRGQERVGGPHHGADVEVVLPVLDRDVERVPARVQVGHDRGDPPVPVAVDDVAGVALGQQLRVVAARRPATAPPRGPRQLPTRSPPHPRSERRAHPPLAPTLVPVMHALGPSWLDPQHLIDTYALPGTLLVVFIECGLFFFLLPGDSLLFTIGLLISNGTLHHSLAVVLPLLIVAAFGGSIAGYEIGRAMGPRIVGPNSRLIKTEARRPDPRLLRAVRRPRPDPGPFRADRAHVHHADRRRQPDGPPLRSTSTAPSAPSPGCWS